MDKYDQELLQFLTLPRAIEQRRATYEQLGIPVDQPSVFYVVALANLVQIVESGGIACRNNVPAPAVELSSTEIQGRRERLVPLKAAAGFRSKSIHNCLNLFWNPINNTLHAFRRNAVFAAHANPNGVQDDIAVVCILCIPLDRIFEQGDWKWAIASGNVAGSVEHAPTWLRAHYSAEEWPWEEIYNGDLYRARRARAAEMLLHSGTADPSAFLPIAAIAEVLVERGAGARARIAVPALADRVREIPTPVVFRPREELIRNEIQGFGSFWRLARNGRLNPEWLGVVFQQFPAFADAAAGPMHANRFGTAYVAAGPHGVGHVTRVMFWAFVISLLSEQAESVTEACLVAASIHDLERFNNDPEPEHGRLASLAHSELVRQKFEATLAADVLEAVEYHSRPDSEYDRRDNNLVWQILKDADALDRGRFGTPIPIGQEEEGHLGCRLADLRSPHFRASPERASELAWFGYRLASLTQYAPWQMHESSYPVLRERVAAAARAALPFMDPRRDHQRLVRFLAGIDPA
jgi:hypothetical protein